MGFLVWLSEHIMEIIIAIIGSKGVYHLIQINKNQKAKIINSPNSHITQVRGVNKSQINIFEQDLNKERGVLGKIPFNEEEPKKLLKKIEEALDNNKPIYLVTEMCLRLAQKLKIKKDLEWLNKEVYGFEELLKEQNEEEGMKMKKKDEKYFYRSIEVKFNLGFNNGKFQEHKVNMFMSQPLSKIESLVKKFNENPSPTAQLVMYAPPLDLMVKILKIPPEKRLPYLIDIDKYENIIYEVRKKLLRFVEEVRKLNILTS